jgi:hypothetical protein
MAAHLLRLESERNFALHLATDNAFWDAYRNILVRTVTLAEEIDQLQKDPLAMATMPIEKYAIVSEGLVVGTIAAAILSGRQFQIDLFRRFCGHLSIAAQILDDFADIEEDFVAGRINFAASILLKDNPADAYEIFGETGLDILAGKLLAGPGLTLLFDLAEENLSQATELAQVVKIPGAASFVSALANTVERQKSEVHRVRVRHVLAPLEH